MTITAGALIIRIGYIYIYIYIYIFFYYFFYLGGGAGGSFCNYYCRGLND